MSVASDKVGLQHHTPRYGSGPRGRRRSTLGEEAAGVEDGDAVGEVHDDVHVVLDQEDGGGAGDVAGEGLEGVDRQQACRPDLPPQRQLCDRLRHHVRMPGDHAHIGDGEIRCGCPRLLPIAQRADRDPEAAGELGLRQAEAGPGLADQARALAPLQRFGRGVEIFGVAGVSG